MTIERYPDKPQAENPDMLTHLEEEGEYIATAKADGWRCILTDEGAFSRHGNRLDTRPDFPPQIMEAFRAMGLPKGTQLDTEWMGMAQANQTHHEREYCYVIGVLKWGEKWLHKRAEANRWALVQSLPLDGKALRHLPRAYRKFEAFYTQMQCVDEFEGVVLKGMGSGMRLSGGKSEVNPHWFKVKWR